MGRTGGTLASLGPIFNSTGSMGIGITPLSALHIVNSTLPTIRIANNNTIDNYNHIIFDYWKSLLLDG